MDDTAAAWRLIGGCVRMARIGHSMTLSELADRVGTDITQLSRFERGERGFPAPTLGRIGEVLSLDGAAMQGRASVSRSDNRACVRCGGPMEWTRSTRLYCTTRCRVAAHREQAHRSAHAPVVYFLRRGDLVKIGTTIRLRDRVRAFQQTLDDVLATIPGDYEVERQWHQRFAHLSETVNGGREWFRAEPELLDAISALDPTALAHASAAGQ